MTPDNNLYMINIQLDANIMYIHYTAYCLFITNTYLLSSFCTKGTKCLHFKYSIPSIL